ncbi:MAG: scpB [Enterovirga sp.]|nr:scpB [Enterovirga sp.]
MSAGLAWRGGLAIAVSNEPALATAHSEAMRMAEAILFASPEPVPVRDLAGRLPHDVDVESVLSDLQRLYVGRGINLVQVAGGWAFRTVPDLAYVLAREAAEPARLSRAAMEVLAIIAYHQPATRAEIEEIRGVSTSKGTLDALLETRWIRMRGRRKAPGRPVTFGTTPAFLEHFGLNAITDLPGLDELQGLGFLEGKIPADLDVPTPSDDLLLTDQEEPLDGDALAFGPTPGEED